MNDIFNKKKSNKIIACIVTLLLAVCFLPGGTAVLAASEQPEGEVVIIYTNDVHCAADGYSAVSAMKKEWQAAKGKNNVTLVDAGDAFQGEVIGTLSKGQYIVDIMNKTGYDVFAPGNHDFDYGVARLFELTAWLDATTVSSNFIDLKYGDTTFVPYAIIDYGFMKIAYVGVTTPESFTKSTPAYFQDASGNYIYGFSEDLSGEKLYKAVQSAVDAARSEGADNVIAVGHLGVEEQSTPWRSKDVIANTTGIDAFIDGHSHTVMEGELVKNKEGKETLLTQTGTKLENIGRMTVSADGSIKTELVAVEDYAGRDEEVQAFIEEIKSRYADDLAVLIGHTDFALITDDPETGERVIRQRETNLGNLCADAVRYVLGNGSGGPADAAILNGGGIRAGVEAGDITVGDVIAVHPFNNAGCVVEATGQQIVDALEMAARFSPEENGGFLHVSGMTYAIDPGIQSSVVTDDKESFVSIDGPRRVKDVTIGGEPIDLTKTYTLASHNYLLLNGGDGLNIFIDNKVLVEPVMLDNQILSAYIGEYLGGVVGDEYSNLYGQGRITIIGAQTGTDYTNLWIVVAVLIVLAAILTVVYLQKRKASKVK